MSATAFKNAVQRRDHKERAQPASRERYGLLEKHKDYVARARNFHAKEDRLAELRRKAEFRNPDEFYHKMLRKKTEVRSRLPCHWRLRAGSLPQPESLFTPPQAHTTFCAGSLTRQPASDPAERSPRGGPGRVDALDRGHAGYIQVARPCVCADKAAWRE